MKNLDTMLDDFLKPFRDFRTSVFNLTYKISATTVVNYNEQRKQFWANDNTLNKSKLNFYLDGSVAQCFEVGKDQTEANLWFEAAMFSKPGKENFPISNQYIIIICDNGDYYENFAEEIKLLTKKFCNVICFNPPGVGRSPGTIESPAEYQEVLEAVIHLLHSGSIQYDDIILLGHGYGAGIALKTAADHQQRNESIRVIADRCFANTAQLAGKAAQDKVHKAIKHPFARKIIGILAYYLVNGVVRILQLNVDAAGSFETIYTLNPKQVRAIFLDGDHEIATETSLAAAVDLKMHGAIKTFFCYSCLNHRAPLTDLTIIGEQPNYMNSAQDYVNIWLNIFNNDKVRTSTEWGKITTKPQSDYVTGFCNHITYMHDHVRNLFAATHKEKLLAEKMSGGKRVNHDKRAHYV